MLGAPARPAAIMPFTPFHMGPGAAVKVLLGSWFSLLVFGFTQVAMDLEPLVRLWRGDAVVHGHTHTYVGALLIGALSYAVGRPICQWGCRLWQRWHRGTSYQHLVALGDISRPAALIGAGLGASSHVLLDSIMHGDMRPLWPLSSANPMLGWLSLDTLHVMCLALGALAVPALLVALYRRHSNSPRADDNPE